MSVDIFSLLVNGMEYYGWKDVSVSVSLETVSGQFQLGVSDKWQGRDIRWPIKPGDECKLMVGGEPLITGWVDSANPGVSAAERTLSVSGRDRTGDMVDCSAVHKPDQWNNRSLEELARIIGEPFGIQVKMETDSGEPFPLFKLQPGETAFAAIERLCRMRGVLATSDGEGNLVLTAPGKAGRFDFVLKEGGPGVLRMSGTFDNKDRFSEYVTKAQQSGPSAMKGPQGGGDSRDKELTKKIAAPTSGKATDGDITRYRPLIILSEGEGSGQSPQVRAAWEATVRAARATNITVVCQGVRAAAPGSTSGPIWRPNRLVRVVSETLDLDEDLLIKSCKYTKNISGGTVTELSLTRPDAYTVSPEIAKGQDTPSKLCKC